MDFPQFGLMIGRKEQEFGPPDEILGRNVADRAERAAVGRIVAVVAHHEIVAGRHDVLGRVVVGVVGVARRLPYDVGTAGQMRFIEHALDVVAPQNGTVIAIVQMSCAIKNEKELIAIKGRLLQHHHLVAVMSMPDDLFYPVGVVTCVMVFKANTPNIGRKTWFGYFKDDGFEKRKNRGRIDARAKWADIKNQWVKAFINKDEISGLSIKQEVSASDEWCAEAYMERDYSKITRENFERAVRDYAIFRVLGSQTDNSEEQENTEVSE